ncbi:MAG TPA: DNA-3-methyladenine glycosylase 2 family protein [Deltaproteobacteria bacterium]|nr:DNA-3-methyladenine glycosylase 2 family protein [Candidatus Binatota bacterium]HIL13291.1 DNA-3-methyladenine glycosylase 2 family protein [Deltaproteobacteria bacterium]
MTSASKSLPARPTRSQLAELARRDPVMARALKHYGPFPGFPQPENRRVPHFESLARSIVFQQLAGAAARAIWQRVIALTPGARLAPPARLLSLPEDQLRGAGLSRNKVAALCDLARRANDGSLGLRRAALLGDDEIIERLVTVRGIGPWTAQMFLMFKLGRLNVMPSTDLGVQEGARALYRLDQRPTPGELTERARSWAPLRSVAAWTLWRVKDGDDEGGW